jgi:hypothetical protein
VRRRYPLYLYDFGVKVIKKTPRMDDDELGNESYKNYSRAFIPAPYPNLPGLPGMKVSYEYVAMTRNDGWSHKPEEFTDPSFVAELEVNGQGQMAASLRR